MNPALVDLLNRQINREFYSSFLYMAASFYFEKNGYFGFAKWALEHADEERKHALKIIEFLQDRRQCVMLLPLDAPLCEFDSPTSAMRLAFEHEMFITGSINEVVAQATQLSDYATFEFLQWFVKEQIEEEKTVSDYLLQMENLGLDKLMILDLELK